MENEAAIIMKQIISAIIYLHNKNIIHRDIKPENIVFNSEDSDTVKLIDFGTSKNFTKDNLQGIVGSSYYVAPEVLLNKCSIKSDIWSCGVLLYILLCGYPPFDGSENINNPSNIYVRILKGKFSFPSDDWDYISDYAK